MACDLMNFNIEILGQVLYLVIHTYKSLQIQEDVKNGWKQEIEVIFVL